jgi:hypothetical protein
MRSNVYMRKMYINNIQRNRKEKGGETVVRKGSDG